MVDDGKPSLTRSASDDNALCLLEGLRSEDDERLLARSERKELGLQLSDSSCDLLECPARLAMPDGRPLLTEPDSDDIDDLERGRRLLVIPSTDLTDRVCDVTPGVVIGAGIGGNGNAGDSKVKSSSGLMEESISGRIKKGNLPVRWSCSLI